MKGVKTVYVCSECSYQSMKWLGKCSQCGAWNSFVEDVVETAMRENVKLVGLSALMTTTVVSMAETIEALRRSGHDCKVMVGGAVLTRAGACPDSGVEEPHIELEIEELTMCYPKEVNP